MVLEISETVLEIYQIGVKALKRSKICWEIG